MYKLLKILFVFALLFLVLDLAFPFRPVSDYSTTVYDTNGNILSTFLNNTDKWRLYASLEEVSDDFVKAILEKEDSGFYYHLGFNPFSILRAAYSNISSAKVVSGASTISMQLARLLEPKERTIVNKIIEVFRAMQLELHYSKKEILEMYLNRIPFGGNIEGIKSASIFFLGKSPKDLSLGESICLSFIPNNPNKFRIGENNQAINTEKNFWLDYHKSNGTFSISRLASARNEEFTSFRRGRHKYALHFCENIKKLNTQDNNIETTLDLSLQLPLEKLCFNYTKSLAMRDIHNSAVIVTDNHTGEVVAYVGSNDFFDMEHSGQVDGVKAIRSPGSTLKPIVYIMAMEAGIITPKTKLPDIPMDFGLYSPENFDKTFSGWISAEDALAKSLNVPAVYLLNKLSKDDFYTRLIRMHFAKLSKNKSDIGLSAILGACGVSLEELNGLYRCIANGGVYSKAHFLKTEHTKKFDTIFNPMANEMVSRMLTKLQRPDYPFAYQYSKDLPEIAWKTGTSYGRKDAWSVGFTSKYTVGVWAGNFDNKGAAGLTGASIATPLLFDIFRILEQSNPSGKLPTKELSEREVCSVTGLPAGKHCPKSLDFYIPFISTNEICNHIRETYISIDGKYEYCYDCLPDKNYKKVIMEYYPPEIAEFYKKNQLPHPEQLPHNPKCTRLVAANKPTITSPLENQEYLAEKGKFKLELTAVISSDASNMNWYADGKFIGSCNVGEKIFYTPEISGSQKITCTDNLGRSTSIFIKISFF